MTNGKERQCELKDGDESPSIWAVTQQAWKMRRLIGLASLIVGSAWFLMGHSEVLACGYWGSLEGTCSAPPYHGLPNPNYGTDWGYNWTMGWSLQGGDGSYTGSAYSQHTIMGDNNDVTTGLHIATGFWQSRVKPWTSGGPGHHGPPGNAKVTGRGDGVVGGSVYLDANNASLTLGHCEAYAYADVTYSGVASGNCRVNLDVNYTEDAPTVSGTWSSTGDASVTITITPSGDIASTTSGNSCTVASEYVGMIAGKFQRGVGTVQILARADHGAMSSTADANTIVGGGLTIDYGGSGGPCPELCATVHDH